MDSRFGRKIHLKFRIGINIHSPNPALVETQHVLPRPCSHFHRSPRPMAHENQPSPAQPNRNSCRLQNQKGSKRENPIKGFVSTLSSAARMGRGSPAAAAAKNLSGQGRGRGARGRGDVAGEARRGNRGRGRGRGVGGSSPAGGQGGRGGQSPGGADGGVSSPKESNSSPSPTSPSTPSTPPSTPPTPPPFLGEPPKGSYARVTTISKEEYAAHRFFDFLEKYGFSISNLLILLCCRVSMYYLF